MRIHVIATMAAIGFGCIGISGASAAPASGTVIKDTAATSNLTEKVWWHRGWGGPRWGWRGGGWGYRRWAYGGPGPGWCYWHPYRCGRW